MEYIIFDAWSSKDLGSAERKTLLLGLKPNVIQGKGYYELHFYNNGKSVNYIRWLLRHHGYIRGVESYET